IVNEEYVFKIKNISSPIAKINNRNCNGCYVNMTLSEFKDAIISAHIENFEHRFSFEVLRFKIKAKRKPAIFVEGNSINEEVYNQLKGLKKQDLITISNIQYRVIPLNEGLWPSLPPLIIRISE
ncbi:MAG: GldM family protein, partial [Flavobacterium sp.]